MDDLHYDLRDGTGFDPRETSCTKRDGHYSDSEGVGVVWRVIVVVRSAARTVVHCHSLDELGGIQSQFGPRCCATTVAIAAPWVKTSVWETPFPSLAWVTRRMTAKN